MQNFLQQRIERVAAGILENEAITASLDDDAADVFLKWALSRAKDITHMTLEVEDEEAADEAMYGRLKAIRRLAKSLARWQTAEDPSGALEKIMGYVADIYGEGFALPDAAILQQFVAMQKGGEPGMMVSALISLLEPEGGTSEMAQVTGSFSKIAKEGVDVAEEAHSEVEHSKSAFSWKKSDDKKTADVSEIEENKKSGLLDNLFGKKNN